MHIRNSRILRTINEGKVAVIPGSFFGAGGQGYVRISYATSMENLTRALDNIAAFINKED